MIKKYKKNKAYYIKWLDHATCYYGWTDFDDVKDHDLPCESVGFFVKESETSLYFCMSKYCDKSRETGAMYWQVLKSAIIESKEIKH